MVLALLLRTCFPLDGCARNPVETCGGEGGGEGVCFIVAVGFACVHCA